MARVTLEGLTKRFGRLEAVKDLNLDVKDGEFTCLLGPSGCGKTTTLRMIAGLETPDNGSIYIGDERVNDLSPAERDVAMVFQFYALYPSMTVYDNLAFPLVQRKMPKNEVDERVRKAAKILRIEHRLKNIATKLAIEEKQKVAIGRAIVRNPRVYLLDEPLTNLDAQTRAIMRAELKKLQKDLGQTTIYVTHDQLEAMTMAERIAVMDMGVLQQYGSPADVFNHPKNLFVAGFLGTPTMNFLEVKYIQGEKSATLQFDNFDLDVSELRDHIAEQATGSELVLGIRPSDVLVSKQRKDGEGMQSEVSVVEPLGDEVIVDLTVGEHLIKAIAPRTFDANIGDKVWAILDKTKVYIFDKKSGQAIV
jgi:multiple sugar transport system ATP-binding protein